MADEKKTRILITSALPYVNGPVHIGHLAGAYLPADIYARYQRLRGRETLFICGSDEHGVPILLRAREEGVEPQAIVDRYHLMVREAFEGFGMSFDHYGRTSAPLHHETSRDFFRKLAKTGVFVRKTEAQLYDPEAGMFLADRFVRGTCPACGHDDAYGDQCESCGRSLSPRELKNPRSAITDAVPEVRDTTHWYLPLGRMQSSLEAWLSGHEDWKPNVLGQVRSWLREGLEDRAVTRDLPWGVPVPEDVAAEASVDARGKVLYVWFDAPIGYISATREWAELRGEPEAWERWWKDGDSELVHFIGKDNIVFHCIIFPAMLQAHGDYVLPANVPANEFLNLEGRKLSTSRGWAVWLHEYLEAFPADYLRYALCTNLPETKDTDFTWRDFQARVNNELADTLGNFVNRTHSFALRAFGGKVPPLGKGGPEDRTLLEACAKTPARVGEAIEGFRFREALETAMALAREGNRYINEREPWKTRKEAPEVCASTLHAALQCAATLSVVLDPFLPASCRRLRAQLGLEGLRDSGPGGGLGSPSREGCFTWDDAAHPLLEAGAPLGDAGILFSKIANEEVEVQVAKLVEGGGEGREEDSGYVPLESPCAFEDFAKIDLRAGRVVSAVKVPKSRKLLRCEVDLGFEHRQILAGVAEHLAPKDLEGKRVVVVANLAPRKMMGLVSEGMLLMAEDREGRLAPVTTDLEPGSVVR